LTATQYVTTTENALKQLILRTTTAAEWSAHIEPSDQPTLNTTPINLPDALKQAFENRPELNRLRLEQDINGIDVKYQRNQTLPRVDLVSTISRQDLPALMSESAHQRRPGHFGNRLPARPGE
jgi:outer membrane protein TolC